jgi:putrescine transport system substrate-binding protein
LKRFSLFSFLIVCLISSIGVSGVFVSSVSYAQENQLRIYNWSHYIDPEVLSDFQAETGIQVVYDEFDSNEVLEALLLSGKHDYDLVVPSNDFLARHINAGLFASLNKSLLTNYSNLNVSLLKNLEVNDPGNVFSVPYLWGTTGIGYNKQLIEEVLGEGVKPTSWGFFFNPEIISKLAECGVSILNSPKEVFAAALNYLERSPNSRRSSDYRGGVKDMLDNIVPHVRYFHSSRYIDDLASGRICLSMGWSGDILQAAEQAENNKLQQDIEYVIPSEGAAIWVDMLAIPAVSQRQASAHAFINYLLRPEVIAKITNLVSYANPNSESRQFIDPQVIENEGIYPSAKVQSRLFVLEPVPKALNEAMYRSWRELKAKNTSYH